MCSDHDSVPPPFVPRRAVRRYQPTSTVGRAKAIELSGSPKSELYQEEWLSLHLGDSLDHYETWPSPTVIISDGAYGVLGFEGDTFGHLDIPAWYEPHVRAWSQFAKPSTTLWFWNSEIGWAAAHPVLERYGWRYVNCNIWNKGKAHIAGNVHTKVIRRFPVVTEVCVHYVREPTIGGLSIRDWLRAEWQRAGLPFALANEACGLRNAASRKYFDRGHLWYFPPPEAFARLARYANEHGRPQGRPYFSIDGQDPMTPAQWAEWRAKFYCPHGVTNVWDRPALRGAERVTVGARAVHLNQKPLDLMAMLIEASSEPGDVIWEPFGGLFTACLAARSLKRRAFGCEIDPTYFQFGVSRAEEGRDVRLAVGQD